jgi:hypothetical protein
MSSETRIDSGCRRTTVMNIGTPENWPAGKFCLAFVSL